MFIVHSRNFSLKYFKDSYLPILPKGTKICHCHPIYLLSRSFLNLNMLSEVICLNFNRKITTTLIGIGLILSVNKSIKY